MLNMTKTFYFISAVHWYETRRSTEPNCTTGSAIGKRRHCDNTIQTRPIRKAIDENVRNLLRNVTATKSMDYRVFGQTIETYRKFFYDMQIELFPQSSTLYHIRKLRNVFAKAIYGISNSIVQVQNSLNHSSPTTTAIYLQQSQKINRFL